MSRPELRAKARFTILAPRSAPAPCAGKADVAGFAAAKAAATKSRAAQAFCGDRLRGHEIRPPPFPRAKRGARIVERAFAREDTEARRADRPPAAQDDRHYTPAPWATSPSSPSSSARF